MVEASALADEIRAARDDLRLESPSPIGLNRAAARIDHLGRYLHGVGWIRGHEIGGCLTAAVSELSRARGLPETGRAESVRAAVIQLETALAHMDEGLSPVPDPTEASPGAGPG
jgi:hypothetical protein